jgi:hypothetical protein
MSATKHRQSAISRLKWRSRGLLITRSPKLFSLSSPCIFRHSLGMVKVGSFQIHPLGFTWVSNTRIRSRHGLVNQRDGAVLDHLNILSDPHSWRSFAALEPPPERPADRCCLTAARRPLGARRVLRMSTGGAGGGWGPDLPPRPFHPGVISSPDHRLSKNFIRLHRRLHPTKFHSPERTPPRWHFPNCLPA